MKRYTVSFAGYDAVSRVNVTVLTCKGREGAVENALVVLGKRGMRAGDVKSVYHNTYNALGVEIASPAGRHTVA